MGVCVQSILFHISCAMRKGSSMAQPLEDLSHCATGKPRLRTRRPCDARCFARTPWKLSHGCLPKTGGAGNGA